MAGASARVDGRAYENSEESGANQLTCSRRKLRGLPEPAAHPAVDTGNDARQAAWRGKHDYKEHESNRSFKARRVRGRIGVEESEEDRPDPCALQTPDTPDHGDRKQIDRPR